jgi:hypothetical protein
MIYYVDHEESLAILQQQNLGQGTRFTARFDTAPD